MGDNTLAVPKENSVADVRYINQFRTALIGTMHTRSNSGEISELYSIGSDLYPYGAAHVRQIVKMGTLTSESFLTTDVYTIPDNVYRIHIIAAGGGGRYVGGGIAEGYLDVIPGDTYDITVSGGTAIFGDSLLVGNIGSGNGGTASVDNLVKESRISQGGDGGRAYTCGGSTIYARGGAASNSSSSAGGGAGYSDGGSGTAPSFSYC